MNDYKKICLLALNDHRQLKRQYQKRMRSLSAYDGMLLQSSLRKGTPYYYCLKKGGKRRYLGRETHEVVRKIRELRFCKKMVEILDDNIRLLREFTERYCDTDVESVRQRLPKQYIPLLIDILELNTDSIEARVQAMRERKATIPPRHPEALRITTFDGTLVRSRVEALLYERFCAAGFYVLYEYPVEYAPGKYLCPDFLLIHPVTGQVILWEHLGRWFHAENSRQYRDSFNWKTDIYRELGFIPGINLQMSFETDSGLDLEWISGQIEYLYNSVPTTSLLAIREKQLHDFADFNLLIKKAS